MSDHPIKGLMDVTLEKIKSLVDVNTIIGDPVRVESGITLIPISKVTFGFASGGSDFPTKVPDKGFGGGSGAGVSIQPVAFMIVGLNQIKMVPVNQTSPIDKLVDYVPDLIDKISQALDKKMKTKENDSVDITIET